MFYSNQTNNIQLIFQACHDLETFVDAYKKDNAWLVRELNSLHLNTVTEKIAFEKRIAGKTIIISPQYLYVYLLMFSLLLSELEKNLRTRSSTTEPPESKTTLILLCYTFGNVFVYFTNPSFFNKLQLEASKLKKISSFRFCSNFQKKVQLLLLLMRTNN